MPRSTLLVTLIALTVHATEGLHEDPALSWRRYQSVETSIDTDIEFPHSSCFRRSAAAYNLPETLLLAVARGESNFDATARSHANAHGVMQIQWPGTAQHLGISRLSALYDPCTNIDAGARYLQELLTRYDNDLHLALAAYNYGPGRIAPGAETIPEGAAWYSAYIFRHLDYVLGNRQSGGHSTVAYSEMGRTVLLSFAEPYRASAFVARVESSLDENAGNIQLDWFRTNVGQFDVVFSYDDQTDFQTGARQLADAGFPLP